MQRVSIVRFSCKSTTAMLTKPPANMRHGQNSMVMSRAEACLCMWIQRSANDWLSMRLCPILHHAHFDAQLRFIWLMSGIHLQVPAHQILWLLITAWPSHQLWHPRHPCPLRRNRQRCSPLQRVLTSVSWSCIAVFIHPLSVQMSHMVLLSSECFKVC